MADISFLLKAAMKKKKWDADKRFYDVIYAEVGAGDPEEVLAVASVFYNLANNLGYEKALFRSSAYNRKSNEYRKAKENKFTPYEKYIYNRNKKIVDNMFMNPEIILPYTNFENVKAFGEPSWAKDMSSYEDVGRQRFYVE